MRVVLSELLGDDAAARFFVDDCLRLVTCARVETRELERDALRGEDHQIARDMLGCLVRLCSRLERRKRAWRVVGTRAFWGQQTERVELTEYEILVREHDARCAAEASGAPPPKPKPWSRYQRRYKRCARGYGAGGLAQESRRSVKTIERWATLFREAGIFGCHQPGGDGEDVVRPQNAVHPFAYGVWSLLRSPPPGLVRALERLRGKAKPKPAPPPIYRAPVRAPRREPNEPTGPPIDDPLELEQAIKEARAMLGMT